ncbi:MAG: translation elongation factor Ts [Candidatus Brocadiae bacterium]|nr:translation elongation factor Ts [Candidatus Brocadiia bacterium]
MAITAQQVNDLRQRTGAGLMECKGALAESGGDLEKAVDILRKKGRAKADKLADREAKAGRVGAYVHFNGKVAAMVELTSETDFVANTDDFQNLLRDIALHISFAKPTVVKREQLSPELIEREKAIFEDQVKGKPAEMAEKILQGKLEKGLFMQHVLLDQEFCNQEKFKGTISEMLKAVVGKIRENITVRRFAWFEIGTGAAASL